MPAAASAIEVRLLGTGQDGGVPQVGCRCERCERARRDPAQRRSAASLLVTERQSGFTLLIDPSPDLAEQYDALLRDDPRYAARAPEAPVFDAVAITHVHLGHYAGLGRFGREAAATRALPVHASQATAAFLRQHAPASLAVRLGQLALVPFVPGARVVIGPYDVWTIPVEHRSEYADTVAFRIRLADAPSDRRATDGAAPQCPATGVGLLYLPDIDRWPAPGASSPPLDSIAAACELALVDATFGSRDELQGRDPADVPHPLVSETLAYFAPAVAAGTRLGLIHLNHTNALGDSASLLAVEARALGFEVPADGTTFGLVGSPVPSEPPGPTPTAGRQP